MTIRAGTGNGWTLTLATTGAIGRVTKLTGFTFDLPEVDTSALATADKATNMPGDLANPGEFDAEVEFDTAIAVPAAGVVETVTVTAALRSGEATAAKWAGSAWIKATTTPDAENNARSILKVKVRWDGVTGPTFTPRVLT